MSKLIKVILEDRYHPCDCEATRILTNAPMSFIKKCEGKANVDIELLAKELGRKVRIDEIPFYREEDFINDLKNNGYVVYTVEDELIIRLD